QAEDGIRDFHVTGVQTCALPIYPQRFARGVKPSDEAQRRILVRRLKSELPKELPPRADGTPRFPERRVVPLEIKYPDAERQIHRSEERRVGKDGRARGARQR